MLNRFTLLECSELRFNRWRNPSRLQEFLKGFCLSGTSGKDLDTGSILLLLILPVPDDVWTLKR